MAGIVISLGELVRCFSRVSSETRLYYLSESKAAEEKKAQFGNHARRNAYTVGESLDLSSFTVLNSSRLVPASCLSADYASLLQ
jgi:hypothetical protein